VLEVPYGRRKIARLNSEETRAPTAVQTRPRAQAVKCAGSVQTYGAATNSGVPNQNGELSAGIRAQKCAGADPRYSVCVTVASSVRTGREPKK